MHVSFKIRNQLAIKPEIFTQGIAKLGQDDLFLGTTFRSFVSKVIENIMKCLPLDHYSTITIEGIYSEFLAILNLSLLFPSSAPLRAGYDFTKYTKLPAIPGPNFVLPLRLKPVKGLGLASLHGNKSVSVYDNCLPLFYKVNRMCTL